MGTHGVIGLIIAAQRHAKFNHFDSYPAGLGQDIVKFILSLTPEEWDLMARLVSEITVSNSIQMSKPQPYAEFPFLSITPFQQLTKSFSSVGRKNESAKQGAPRALLRTWLPRRPLQ